jgi:zinc transporter 2
MCLSVIFITA